MQLRLTKGLPMANQNQDPGRQNQGSSTGKRTPPQDPKVNRERDDDNTIQRRTSDEGAGRDRSASQQDEGRSRNNPSQGEEQITDDDANDRSDSDADSSDLTRNP